MHSSFADGKLAKQVYSVNKIFLFIKCFSPTALPHCYLLNRMNFSSTLVAFRQLA